ncbi:MAG TPA: hypothetical protein PK760_02325 [Flavobacteriales bacterium]|nr:hypothetical protein [Flavobacteriales bacterium]
MGTPLNNDQTEHALRSLLQEHGALRAPEGMESRIMQHIALLPKPSVVPTPLMPKWAWGAAGLTLLAVGIGSFTIPTNAGTAVPFLDVDIDLLMLTKWIAAAAVCTAILFALDLQLVRTRTAELR